MVRKKMYVVVLLLTALCFQANAQSQVRQSLRFYSSVLSDSVAYSVYLPDGYQQSQRNYPVVYLLHGMWGSEKDWIQYGHVQEIMDEGIDSGKWSPMIIIMPDAGNCYYVNDRKGEYRYEEMFFFELIPKLEGRYRIYGREEMRAICGLSMGGFGSMLYAMKHPSMFSACASSLLSARPPRAPGTSSVVGGGVLVVVFFFCFFVGGGWVGVDLMSS